MVLLDLSLQSFRRQKSVYLLWLLSLSLAVTGLVIIDVYRSSLSQMIERQGRKILSGDLSLSARRQLTESERTSFMNALPKGSQTTEVIEMMAMVRAGSKSRLAQLRFIDDNYPLFGDLNLRQIGSVKGNQLHSENSQEVEAWVAPDLLSLLAVESGSHLKIGELNVKIAGVLDKDSTQSMRFSGIAPRLYLAKRFLKPSQLLQLGSTFDETLVAFISSEPSRDQVKSLKREIELKIPDAGARLTTPQDLEQGSLRVLTRLLDFLALIGLVTLTLGWIGVYYLGRRWLLLERKPSAILKCLGFSDRQLRNLLSLKLALVLCLGVLIGGILSWMGARALFPIFRTSLPAEFELIWSWRSTLLLLSIGPLAGFLLLYEPLFSLSKERPLELFQGEWRSLSANLRRVGLLIFLSALLFIFLTFLQARSFRVTGIFLSGLIGSTLGVSFLAWLGLKFVKVARRHFDLGWRMHLSSAQWLGRSGTTILLVSVGALAGLLAQLVPSLQQTLVGDINAPKSVDRPALFLFDVQDEQIEPLTSLLTTHGIQISEKSPFVRARILKINGENFERAKTGAWSTREQEVDARMRNRGVNLSYRKALSNSESILRGNPYNEMGANAISVESEYAERLGIKIGDQLVFDVQGVEVPAQVANLRTINWDSFQPNFFIQFRSEILEGAPKTWVMTIERHPQMKATQMQSLIAENFPNISSINVSETLDTLVEMIGKMSSGLKVASRLALGLGIFVFLVILMFQIASSEADWVQLRMQGLTRFEIWQLQMLTFGTLALIGSLLGGVLSSLVNWALARYAFHAPAIFDVPQALILWGCTLFLTILGITVIGLRRSRQLRAQGL